MTTRVPLLELGSLQSRRSDLIAKKGAPPDGVRSYITTLS
jgi:hypothetical protein